MAFAGTWKRGAPWAMEDPPGAAYMAGMLQATSSKTSKAGVNLL